MSRFVVCVIYSTYGIVLWASSEESQNNARVLATINGYVYYGDKDNVDDGGVRRARVFLFTLVFDLRQQFVVKFGVFSGLREVSLYV